MAPGVPARVAVVCILTFGMLVHARAQAPEPPRPAAARRPVAVIDLAGQTTTSQLARQLYGELANHPELQPLADPAIAAELFGDDEGEDARYLREARAAKDEAEVQLGGRFDFRRAEELARTGQDALLLATPSASAIVLYARLAFVLGQAQLGLRRPADAAVSFALAHRLDPGFVPSGADYPPDVVEAYLAAKPAGAATGKLAVTGAGRLWLDGKDVGLAPLELDAATGPHVVWLTGADRQTRGAAVIVGAQPAAVAIPDAPATERLKVRRARAQLRFAPDPAARAAAMRQLADLVDVRDAVLLSMANGKVIVQTWNAGTRDSAPGFSALRERKPDEPALALLAPLAPPKKPDVIRLPPIERPNKPIVVKPWYERRGVQASVAVGVVAAIIGSVYLIRSLQDDSVPIDPGFGPATRVRW